MKPKITIIGAGISGLTAAVYLHRKGFEINVLEATERAGGRIKTDIVDDFRLDRGFQVLLTDYPETKALLDYEKLNLKRFLPGATVLYDGGKFEIADPFRRPSALLETIFAPVGSLKDKINTFLLKNRLVKITVPQIFNQPETDTFSKLKNYGFSNKMIELFYKPFFSGIFLENDLKTSSNMFDFVMKMFSEGDAAIPELGMEEIPKQLVAMLPKNSIAYNIKVSEISNNKIICEKGQIIETDTIIIATEATSFAKKYIPENKQKFQSVTNVYFESNFAPTNKSIVVLNASTKRKWVNNLTVISNISYKYAPTNKVLIAVSLNGSYDLDDKTLSENMKTELGQWYGNQVTNWKMIKTYKIKYALPNQDFVSNELSNSEMQINQNLFICGDHLFNGSINAAMKSGRLVAELIENQYYNS
ncbi:MAG: FAD-dependent oxidoreductase [Flavobacterium sp.]|nr:FAD-dependent oxidoreductase [Flavobacterium sp.]